MDRLQGITVDTGSLMLPFIITKKWDDLKPPETTPNHQDQPFPPFPFSFLQKPILILFL